MQENIIKFISKDPIGKDLFEGQAQENIANVIANKINEENENHKIIGTEGSWGTGKSNLIKQNEQVIEILNTNIDTILKIFNCAEPNIKEAYEEKLITAKNTLSNSKIELLCNKLNIGLSH